MSGTIFSNLIVSLFLSLFVLVCYSLVGRVLRFLQMSLFCFCSSSFVLFLLCALCGIGIPEPPLVDTL
ncbi:hypothetical protein QBC47DRAFT_375020 [Echria macrotheca]|uniref:Uncharacterized protein n=1 Tax=Echria macrotheca TaxID=438768 RepID=A0AAJ0BIG2_9PEZI|nr:hypothetical protein QBC47DRAFT_375020 [Echria macrotheca]